MRNILFYFIIFCIAMLFIQPVKAGVNAHTDTLLNIVAPNFTLVDINGKNVSLADYKGKVLVIDFWATWCVPCLKSFPSMQMAVDQYKNDPDVKFLFIDTWEKTEDYIDQVRKILAQNHYDFRVLLDEPGTLGIQNKVYSDFEVHGIPTRIIIDRNGIMRFKTGYNEEKRLSDMIEQVKSKN